MWDISKVNAPHAALLCRKNVDNLATTKNHWPILGLLGLVAVEAYSNADFKYGNDTTLPQVWLIFEKKKWFCYMH